jgi:drug/metabolite transporter (DMT)-like permease
MVLSLIFFSINSLTLKHLDYAHVSPWIALLFRAVVGMVFVALMFGFGGQVSFRRALTDRMLAFRGLLGVLGTIAYYLTVPALGAGKATIISSTYVVISAMMAVWFLKESFSAGKLAGNALAFVGLTLLLAMPTQLVVLGWADILAVFGAFAAAGTVIVIRKLTRTESTAMIYASQCVYVLLGAVPMAAYELQRNPISRTSFVTLVLAAISATIGQLAMTEGFKHLNVAVGGAIQICLPVIISIGGIMLFGETFSNAQVFGAVLILGGCYWVMIVR